MKKFDRKAIFTKAWRLVRNYNMDMSTALIKSWKMAKLEILENEKFLLDMKDLSGGANNIVAQNQIRANNAAIDELRNKISTLEQEIYPTIKETRTYLTNKGFQAKESMKLFKAGSSMYDELAKKVEENTRIQVCERLDTDAYNAA